MFFKFRNDTKGQSLVELTLILPFLIFLLLGIMEGGRLFAGYLELQNAARDGARYAAVHTEIDAVLIVDKTKDYIKGRFTMLDPTELDVTGNYVLNLEESADKKDLWVEIKLNYPFKIITPVISTVLGNPFEISATMSMRRE
ncbi:pilus assembly protein [Metallumcola ferriviriculae]|uniref:Pilus assembly protein n=1 Tax=Metallumcola ferriviriculae TaxID=3039180 RepID=A0AAU0UPD9_9FIRM|nr:pilus assembly protein [Desulfitibacteraceae bacterium MK1]